MSYTPPRVVSSSSSTTATRGGTVRRREEWSPLPPRPHPHSYTPNNTNSNTTLWVWMRRYGFLVALAIVVCTAAALVWLRPGLPVLLLANNIPLVAVTHGHHIFGPAGSTAAASSGASLLLLEKNGIPTFAAAEQRAFLQQYGGACQASFASSTAKKDSGDDETTSTRNNQKQKKPNTHSTTTTTNLLLDRFDALPAAYGIELWKYCRLYLAPGLYWDAAMAPPIPLLEDAVSLLLESSSDGGHATKMPNFAIAMDHLGTTTTTNDVISDFLLRQPPLHHSLLSIQEPHSKVALGMLRYLLEAETLSPSSLYETLTSFVANDIHKHRGVWKFLSSSCLDDVVRSTGNPHDKSNSNRPPIALHVVQSGASSSSVDNAEPAASRFSAGEACSATKDEPCCQVWPATAAEQTAKQNAHGPVLFLRHAQLVASPEDLSVISVQQNALPFRFASYTGDPVQLIDTDLGMPSADLPFVATVREFPTHAPPASRYETPNYFDILMRNNCLPRDKECFKCLKLGYKEGDEGGDCHVCEEKCPCYCKALCQVRPPPKRLASTWEVTLPRFRMDPSRLIPRVIHQTWFEPVTKESYPNMSRLIESFRQSGWEYEFYDDDRAAQFISAHFPPQVREAYDSIIPGAFRADLFRYCVLLIRGGVYADMDIMLESNLDFAVESSIGFMTAQDSPGETIGHRSCLWNGLMASTPGHVFLAQTIQNVVNNVRNRFTSVDYDDMLCPNPVLSVSHTVDTLFTCGPCILGASLNDVLKRHRQTGFEFGDIDIYETERKKNEPSTTSSSKRLTVSIERDDPRLLIPGRSVLLRQNKEDMGSHRFTNAAANLIVAATDMPEYDDRPKSIEHYSKSHVKFGVYGLTKLYTNNIRANEEIAIRVKPTISS